jgi:hypothetical protein
MILLFDAASKPDQTLATIVSANSAEPKFPTMKKVAAKVQNQRGYTSCGKNREKAIRRMVAVSTPAHCSPGSAQTINP